VTSDAAAAADLVADEVARVEAALALRWPESVLEPSLDRVRAVLDLLAEPQRAYPVIHLAGTNGKTSTARMIESLLRAFGLHTGRFTSPHLEDVRERLVLDGESFEPERFVRAYDDVIPFVEIVDERSAAEGGPRMSYFEVLTVMAFAGFADAPVDVAVVETGMGGTWDATNVADSVVAVVMPVGLDHQRYLGDTIEEIAAEKAGILKPGTIGVMAQQALPVAEILLRAAVENDVRMAREGLEFGVLQRELAVGGQLLTLQGLGGAYEQVFLPLHGAHQAHNAACALAAVEAFLGGGQGLLDVDAVREGFASVTSPGRLEAVRGGPTVLLDAAHNTAAAEALVTALRDEFAFERLVGVVAMLDDKDVVTFLGTLEPVIDELVVTTTSSPRALDVDELAAVAVDVFGESRVRVVTNLVTALDDAVTLAEDGTPHGSGVLVTGSVVTVGEARALLRSNAAAPGSAG
jgi:dihydrofolate synthase/folylpolyglutamate synthase